MQKTLSLSLVIALGVTTSGCSFVAVRRPPRIPPDAPLECTESRAAPVADTVGAVLTVLAGLVAYPVCLGTVSAATQEAPSNRDCAPVAIAAGVVTAAYAASAIYGYKHTGTCKRLLEERRMRQAAPALVPVRPGG